MPLNQSDVHFFACKADGFETPGAFECRIMNYFFSLTPSSLAKQDVVEVQQDVVEKVQRWG